MRLEKTKKILIIRLSSLGDVILTTPLIRSIKNAHPAVEIDFCVRQAYVDVLKLNPYLHELFIYTNQSSHIQEIKAKIHAGGYNAIIDLQNNYRSKFLLQGIKAPIYRFKKHTLLKFLLVRFKINLMSRMPPIPVRYARSFRHFHLDNGGLDIFIPENTPTIADPSEKFVGLCPGSRHYTKMWPFDFYVELGQILKLKGYRVIIFGGKMEHLLCKTIAERIPGALDACNDDELFKTVANMRICKAIVTNDSGLMHIAAALQKPTIAIFGSSVREFGFTPYHTVHEIIENETLRCRPCSHIGKAECPQKHFHCMIRLSPTSVYQNLSYLLAKQ